MHRVPPPRGCRGEREWSSYILDLRQISKTQHAIVGGKAANLGELNRIDGIRVPPGFCVTADAFARAIAGAPSIEGLLDALSKLAPNDREAIGALGAEVRRVIEDIAVPDDLANEIAHALELCGEDAAYAVRSSAMAEDSPGASFAGQHDTHLNVSGRAAVLRHVKRCWASLFSERAVTYRLRKGLDQRRLRMAVVVQRMVFPRASGVMFTADPLTGHRKTVSVQACFGLGEALVSGRANADAWTVRESGIVTRAIADKPLAVIASPAGGVREEPVDTASRRQPALSDSEVMRLATLGRRIEAHFGAPQDIEWCLADDDVLIVQSRPITTLFPVPVAPERGNRVYVSTGHQQMMTDAMKPLGISMWQLTAARPMYEAGGRLFVDITSSLASPAGRAGILAMLAKSDPLIGDALQAILDRGDFIALQPDADPGRSRTGGAPTLLEDNSAIVAELVAHGRGPTRASCARSGLNRGRRCSSSSVRICSS